MLRQFPSSLAGESRFFLGTNRGKRALTLDLKQPEGLAVLHRMVASADVLVENFRPSVPARLGIDYPRLRAINPRLIYAGLTGYGDGPLSEKGGFDQVLQCLSGMAVFQGGGPRGRNWYWVRCSTTSPRHCSPMVSLPHCSNASVAEPAISQSLAIAQRPDDSGRPLCVGRERRAERRTRFGHWRAHRYPSDAERRTLHFSALQPFLRCLMRADWPPRAGQRPTLRDNAQPRCACRRLAAGLRAALAAHTALEWEEIFGERVPAQRCARSKICSTIRRFLPRSW